MAAMAALAGCVVRQQQQQPMSMKQTATTANVTIDNFTFSPAELTIAPGTRVVWVNHDDIPHTATSDANPRSFSSPALDTDETFSFVFTTPGDYAYFCAIHPHMRGKIVVK
jgi:plastocyanin